MNAVVDTARREKEQYTGGADRPLGSYLATLAVYGLTTGTMVLLGRRMRDRAPSIGLSDLALMTITTHKVSRVIAKDPVTSPLRAPFTRYSGTAGPAEVAEEVRGKGVRHAVGELVTCPFCIAQWVATAYSAGLVFAPQATRLAGATMTAVAGSDWLQLAYARLQQAAEG
ncbi:DUF1360 domain-containing protein [Actinomadura livida]|uniref:DUF1360 domain-containing protein n=1 Tax=Actinomadura livida TaxID=79909 RepID=A0A7W7MXE6_9ACTN|nr:MULTISPECIES: DUF1360 domain-containing protein [Actinomadura]MBB4773842.1 hypothetical protein [Actinomadura catellatispora]GGU11097.1 hypothetical protein GCM10010208_39850 [Actinomadura livida]